MIGFIDSDGKYAIKSQFDQSSLSMSHSLDGAPAFSEGLCLLKKFSPEKLAIANETPYDPEEEEDDWCLGFIDTNRNMVIPCRYELAVADAYPFPYFVVPEFQNGFAYIKSFKGYIDANGKECFSGERVQDHYDFSH